MSNISPSFNHSQSRKPYQARSQWINILLSILLLNSVYSQKQNENEDDNIEKEVDLNYLLFLPESYNTEPNEKWPLILFLHGIGERGNNLELLKIHGIPRITGKDKKFPFIALSPQCPVDYDWRDEDMQQAVLDLLIRTLNNHRVDTERIYITGLSMGGYGTWSIAAKRPELFAAAVPICGGGDPATASLLKDLPIWAFHGARDETVPPEETEKMVDALKRNNGKVRYSLYPNAFHDSWTETYDNPELYNWLLKHKRTVTLVR